MAAMSTMDRTSVGAAFQSDASRSLEGVAGVTKSDVQAAVAAADDWVVANASSFNSALPVAARTGLTTAQKARLLLYVIKKRYEVGA